MNPLDRLTGGTYSRNRNRKQRGFFRGRTVIGAAQYVPAAKAGIDIATCVGEGMAAFALIQYSRQLVQSGECPEAEEEYEPEDD